MNEVKCQHCGTAEISERVAKYSAEKYGKILCYKCQKDPEATKSTAPAPEAKQDAVKEEKVQEEKIQDQPTNRNDKWKLNPAFIIKIQGKEFITANGLLEIADQQAGGVQKIEVVQLTTDAQGTMAHVRVTMKDGRVFEDCGTATAKNLKPGMQIYPVEMAVTRARSRAIRFGLNVDYCSVEELSE